MTEESRRSESARGLIAHIARRSRTPSRLMEFCGGHTVAILRSGLRQLMPPTIELVSGPGCPVCVTANADIDRAVALARVPGIIFTTFGDVLRVPGSRSSLEEARAEGADVRIVYSPTDALAMAKENPERPVAFLGIGFETTAPAVAASILEAEEKGLSNYYVLSQHKLCPPVIKALLDAGEINLQGIISPGHVSAVIGALPWEFIARDYRLPCVVCGFEPLDILQGIAMLVELIEGDRSEVAIAYRRGVRREGNARARELMAEVFQSCTANWRGMGEIPQSGLALRKRYQSHDAALAFDLDPGPALEHEGCLCGAILRGTKAPRDCPLFGRACDPEHPVGPCMVSGEGSCSAHFRYGGDSE